MRLRHGAVVVATTLFFPVDPLQARSDSPGWSQFRGPNGSGVAGGHLYTISEKGVVSVVKTGDELQLVHQSDLGEAVSATPAIDESTLYVRTRGRLLALRRP